MLLTHLETSTIMREEQYWHIICFLYAIYCIYKRLINLEEALSFYSTFSEGNICYLLCLMFDSKVTLSITRFSYLYIPKIFTKTIPKDFKYMFQRMKLDSSVCSGVFFLPLLCKKVLHRINSSEKFSVQQEIGTYRHDLADKLLP